VGNVVQQPFLHRQQLLQLGCHAIEFAGQIGDLVAARSHQRVDAR
jgi:hypothetical protein